MRACVRRHTHARTHTRTHTIRTRGARVWDDSRTRRRHVLLQREGWGEKVDKEHHLKMDGFMRHADKCLQLGEKPFVSGGMKASGGR